MPLGFSTHESRFALWTPDVGQVLGVQEHGAEGPRHLITSHQQPRLTDLDLFFAVVRVPFMWWPGVAGLSYVPEWSRDGNPMSYLFRLGFTPGASLCLYI